MDIASVAILVAAGGIGGFVAGLIGVGGGIVFAPVLFFYFSSIGIAEGAVTPLTLGTSLCCTFIASFSSAWSQYVRKSVHSRIALTVGLFSALAILLVTHFVTTRPWYDGTAFQIVFSIVLLMAVLRMLLPQRVQVDNEKFHLRMRASWYPFAGIGAVAGSVAALAGVGGGIVMVPAYYYILGLPMRLTTGTSSASVVIISAAGVVSYIGAGWSVEIPGLTAGYVDAGRATVLAIPALFAARLGVSVAHRINTRYLKISFAVMATFVALRLLTGALWD